MSTYFSSDVITPSQMFNDLLKKASDCAKLVGSDIYDPNFRPFTFLFNATLVVLFGLVAINVYDIYLFRNDIVRCVFCMITLSASFQSLAKTYTFIVLRQNQLALKEKAENFLVNLETPEFSEVFEKWMMLAAHTGVFITVLYLFCVGLIIVYPVIFYFIFGERILHFGIEIPMLDWKESWVAYGLNFLFQCICLILFVSASIATNFIVICLLTSAFGQFEMLNILISHLNQLAINNDEGKNNGEIKAAIKLLVQKHMELIE